MEDPVSASVLSELSGSGTSWIVGGHGEDNLAQETVMHAPLETAPSGAQGVARRMAQVLDKAWLPASESDTQGRVVVITGGAAAAAGGLGPVSKEVCLEALGIKSDAVDGKMLWTEARITPKDLFLAEPEFCALLYRGRGRGGGRGATIRGLAQSSCDHRNYGRGAG